MPFLLGALVLDYTTWEQERLTPSGLFWQHDVWDGMEESISGSRTAKNLRPTLNSYMYANAVAIGRIADLAGKQGLLVEGDGCVIRHTGRRIVAVERGIVVEDVPADDPWRRRLDLDDIVLDFAVAAVAVEQRPGPIGEAGSGVDLACG